MHLYVRLPMSTLFMQPLCALIYSREMGTLFMHFQYMNFQRIYLIVPLLLIVCLQKSTDASPRK